MKIRILEILGDARKVYVLNLELFVLGGRERGISLLEGVNYENRGEAMIYVCGLRGWGIVERKIRGL